MLPGSLIPIGDDDSGVRRTHYAVWLLILINIAVFIHELRLPETQLGTFIFRYGTIPFEITNFEDIPPEVGFPVVGTIFTSMFLHGGFLHIGSNMLFLWIFGDNIEDVMGHFGFLVFYFICGVIAAAGQILVNTDSLTPMIGASGAISGVLAAYLVLFPRGMVRVATIIVIIPLIFRLPAVIVIGMWILLQIFSGYASLGLPDVESGTAYFAHIGGFVAGLLLVWVFADPREVRRQNAARRWF